MKRGPKTRGSAPKNLTGRRSVSALESPWWTDLSTRLAEFNLNVGDVLQIEKITERLPSYTDGRRPKPRTAARRLAKVLELVERGPNGSRSRGASYRILQATAVTPNGDDHLAIDDDWLLQSIERMTGGK